MKARVTLKHSATVIVEGETMDAIQDWMNQTTPSEAEEQARKNGHPVGSDYTDEEMEEPEDKEADIVIGR